MSNLQWALLLLVVVVVIGVYFYMRKSTPLEPLEDEQPRADEQDNDQSWQDADLDWLSSSDMGMDRSSESSEPPSRAKTDPVDADETSITRAAAMASAGQEAGARREARMPEPPERDQKLIVMHVAAPQGERFGGEAVHVALADCRLLFGPKQIFHRIKEVRGVPTSVFSVANMLKPGYLDPMDKEQLRTPGLSLFMVLPGPEEPVPAFRDLRDTAAELARKLGGEVLDERRQPLTRQMSQFLAEEVADLERRQLAERGVER